MCCFSKAVKHIAQTRIFARDTADKTQYLVYEMQYESAEDVAMILPLPTVKNAAESAVDFINLEDYPDFFADLEQGFPPPRGSKSAKAGSFGGKPKLKVVDVGQFEASFVPAVSDFSRLDERFRLPETAPRGFTVVFRAQRGRSVLAHRSCPRLRRADPHEP